MKNMEFTFPAIKGRMGERDYYVALFPLDTLTRVLTLTDWAELPPEMRAQRVLNEKRVPEITRYVLDHDEDWVFSSLTASFEGEARFLPISKDTPDIGALHIPLRTRFLVNDGQHRLAALEAALRENRSLGDQTISVVLFPSEDLQRSQQMFSDLNRTVQKTSRSLDILYDHRDPINQITLLVARLVPIFKNRVEIEAVSLSARSAKLVTLSSLYNANERLLGKMVEESLEDANLMSERTRLAQRYWQAVSANIPEWGQVLTGELRPYEARADTISFHAVALWGLGVAGRTLIDESPDDWEDRLEGLREVDWRRSNPEWQGIAMLGSDIINRRQTRDAVGRFLLWKLGINPEPPQPVLAGATIAPTTRVPRLPSEVTELLVGRPPAWEYLYFGSLLLSGRDGLAAKYHEHILKRPARSGAVITEAEAASLLRAEFDNASAIVASLNELWQPAVQDQAFGPPGQSGDPGRIHDLAGRWTACYERLLDWSARLRSVGTPDSLKRLFDLSARFVDLPIEQYRDFVDKYVDRLDTVPELLADGVEVEIELTLTLSIDEELEAKLTREIEQLT